MSKSPRLFAGVKTTEIFFTPAVCYLVLLYWNPIEEKRQRPTSSTE